jgi:hypothetical protein
MRQRSKPISKIKSGTKTTSRSRLQRPPSLEPALSRSRLQTASAATRLSVARGFYRLSAGSHQCPSPGLNPPPFRRSAFSRFHLMSRSSCFRQWGVSLIRFFHTSILLRSRRGRRLRTGGRPTRPAKCVCSAAISRITHIEVRPSGGFGWSPKILIV